MDSAHQVPRPGQQQHRGPDAAQFLLPQLGGAAQQGGQLPSFPEKAPQARPQQGQALQHPGGGVLPPGKQPQGEDQPLGPSVAADSHHRPGPVREAAGKLQCHVGPVAEADDGAPPDL